MGLTRRAATGGALLLVAGIVASACSSSPAKHSSTTTTHASTATTSTTTTTATTTTTTTTTAPVAASCQVSGLRISAVGHGGAAGTQEMTFSLMNTSSTSCNTYGYPGMLLVSTAGAPLPTTVDRGGGLSFENISPGKVTLAAGATAYFNVGFNDVRTGTTTCSQTHRVDVTPPTNTTHATVTTSLGIDACDNGTLHVSAVFASTDTAATQTTAPSQTG